MIADGDCGRVVSGGYKKSGPEAVAVTGSGPRFRGGGYLLSHFRSIIDVVRFNFSVRNGKRWSPHAMATLVSSVRNGILPCKVRKRRGSEVKLHE